MCGACVRACVCACVCVYSSLKYLDVNSEINDITKASFRQTATSRLTRLVTLPGNHSCNGSAPHTVVEGDVVTYTCNFGYRGKRVEPMLWQGAGITGVNEVSHVTQSCQAVSIDCYVGKQRQTRPVPSRATRPCSGTAVTSYRRL